MKGDQVGSQADPYDSRLSNYVARTAPQRRNTIEGTTVASRAGIISGIDRGRVVVDMSLWPPVGTERSRALRAGENTLGVVLHG